MTFLLAIKSVQARVVAGITDKDIFTRKAGNPDYGIMGIGLQPNDACVVSTFRLKKNNPSDNFFLTAA